MSVLDGIVVLVNIHLEKIFCFCYIFCCRTSKSFAHSAVETVYSRKRKTKQISFDSISYALHVTPPHILSQSSITYIPVHTYFHLSQSTHISISPSPTPVRPHSFLTPKNHKINCAERCKIDDDWHVKFLRVNLHFSLSDINATASIARWIDNISSHAGHITKSDG